MVELQANPNNSEIKKKTENQARGLSTKANVGKRLVDMGIQSDSTDSDEEEQYFWRLYNAREEKKRQNTLPPPTNNRRSEIEYEKKRPTRTTETVHQERHS